MNKKFNTTLTKNSPLKIIATLIAICGFWSFSLSICLQYFDVKNILLEAFLGSYLISTFVAISFYYLFLLPRWKKLTNDNSFIDQQIKGLNEVAIITASTTEGVITYVNDNFCKISGYTKEEILGNNHLMFRSDYHDLVFYEEIWSTISSGRIWKGKIKSKAKNGNEYWFFSSIIPLRNIQTGKIEEYISIRFDITHEKNLEAELEIEQAKIIHMGRLAALGEMAGSVAHEINNPIAVILGKIHLLKRTLEKIEDEAIKEKTLAKIQSIEEHSKRITRIVKGLREFSHGGENEKEEEIHASHLIESVTDLCGEKIKTNAVILKTNCPDFKFISPKLPLEQVLVNLINNSVDAISGRKEKWIEVNMSESEFAVHISVTDSGDGISKEIVNKIMLPFFTTKPVGIGTGLGLSISKGLIERMGGDFYYESNCSHTCFKISLPKDEASIFSSLRFSFVIECMKKAKTTLDLRLKLDKIEKPNEEFSLHVPECPFYEWITRFEARLGKNTDFIELKKCFENVQAVMNDIEWKYINQNLINEVEIAKAHKTFEKTIDAMNLKLAEMEEKYKIKNEESSHAS